MSLKKEKLEICDISKTYSNKKVVREISLYIDSGEIVGLLGPNGAGKTTCFYMITGMVRPDSGKILMNDLDITDMPMYKRALLGIGYLPQESSIFKGLNVEDNILAILELTESDYSRRMQKLESLLADFSISHLRKTDSIRLSGGERRRLEIARALSTNPKFICLDEPLAGIDPISVSEVKDLIMALKKRNIGVIITEHNIREILSILDRAYIIHEGKVLISGKASEVVKDKKVKKFYLGESFNEK